MVEGSRRRTFVMKPEADRILSDYAAKHGMTLTDAVHHAAFLLRLVDRVESSGGTFQVKDARGVREVVLARGVVPRRAGD